MKLTRKVGRASLTAEQVKSIKGEGEDEVEAKASWEGEFTIEACFCYRDIAWMARRLCYLDVPTFNISI